MFKYTNNKSKEKMSFTESHDLKEKSFLGSVLSLPMFSNIGLVVKSTLKYFPPRLIPGLTVIKKMTSSKSKQFQNEEYKVMDIPHPKFFHRRIIGH